MDLKKQNHYKYLLILCSIQLLLGIFYLGSVPRIFFDEAVDSSIGYELAQTGVLRHPFLSNLGGIDIHFVQPHIILPLLCAAVFKVAGYSIINSRIPPLLMSFVALVFLYFVTEEFFGIRQAFFVSLAAITNFWFWISARHCRPETCYMAFALLFLWFVILYFRRGSSLNAFLAGIMAALACLTHPNGLLIVTVISISWIIWKEKPQLLKFVLWSLAGFILTILPYVIYVFWATRNPNVSFFEQMMTGRLGSSIISRELIRWGSFLQLPFGIPLFLVIFISWLAAWWKSTAEDKFFATVAVIYPLILPLFNVNQVPDYLVIEIPFFATLIVRFICRLDKFVFLTDVKSRYFIAKSMVILIYTVSSFFPIIFILYKHRNADFNKVVNEVVKVIKPKARVYASPVFWIGHDRYVYGPYTITIKDVSAEEALQWAYLYSFDYVIRTNWDYSRPPQGLKNVPRKMRDFENNVIDVLCEYFGNKIYEFYNEDYGPVEIYKLDWSKAWKYGLIKKDLK